VPEDRGYGLDALKILKLEQGSAKIDRNARTFKFLDFIVGHGRMYDNPEALYPGR
jgi:hypothetical protein